MGNSKANALVVCKSLKTNKTLQNTMISTFIVNSQDFLSVFGIKLKATTRKQVTDRFKNKIEVSNRSRIAQIIYFTCFELLKISGISV